MKKALFLSLIFFVSCAGLGLTGQENEAPSDYTITQVLNTTNKFGKVRVTYKSNAQYKIQTEDRIKNEMLSDIEANKLRKIAPPGGSFIIHLYRSTIEAANLKSFSYIIFKNGQEVSRYQGGSNTSSSVPRPPDHSQYAGPDKWFWSNMDIVNIPVEIGEADKVSIFAVDIFGGRDEFTLAHNPKK